MDTKKATSMVASGGAAPTSYSTSTAGINGSSDSHALRQPPAMSASAPLSTKVAKEKANKKKTKDKNKNKKKKTASEKVPLMGKVKQAKMAHKMTKGLTWRQRWKLYKCYRKLSKLCSSCCYSTN